MTPDFHIVIDGHQDATDAIRERFLSLRISDEEGYRSDALELRLDDRGGIVELPRRGAVIYAQLGYRSIGRVRMGRYAVDEVKLSGFPETLVIRATAADLRDTAKQRRTRSWNRVTIGELVAKIARELGLEAWTAGGLASIVLPHVDQTDESDLHLLTRLGELYDAVARPAGGRLVFTRRGAGVSVTGSSVTPARIKPEIVSSYSITIDDRQSYRSVAAYWYDKASASRKEVTVGGGEPVYALRDDQVDEATARYAAQARLDALNRAAATLNLTLPGLPTISAEGALTLESFREGIDGRWIVTRVTHQLDSSGYRTEVEAQRPT